MADPISTASISFGISAAAGTTLVQEVCKNIVAALGKLSESKKELDLASKRITKLYKNIASLRNVKTIWQPDKPIDLNTFYYPAKILLDDQRKKEINELSDIPESNNVILEGTVGLGKSILLRYLGSRELQTGRIVPILIELRYRNNSRTLQDLLLEQLQNWGFPKSIDVLESLLATGKAIVLCDAFDEVADELQSDVVRELEQLIARFPAARVIVTSRPDSGVQKSPLFRTLKLALLENEDIPAVVCKLDSETEQSANLIKELRGLPEQIEEVLKTPLMVTLLVIAYKRTNRIPQTVNEFYESLFDTLLTRHDGMKVGYRRPRKSNLNDLEFRKVFETFCFYSRHAKLSAFSQHKALELADAAIKYERISADPSDFIADVKRITCLLLEESGKVYFIHKSVQEFFCSCFLQRLSYEKAKIFYESCARGAFWPWQIELSFLKHMDRNRFMKYFDLPLHRLLVNTVWKRIPRQFTPPSNAGIQRLLDSCVIYKVTPKNFEVDKNPVYYHIKMPPWMLWADGAELSGLGSHAAKYVMVLARPCNRVSWGHAGPPDRQRVANVQRIPFRGMIAKGQQGNVNEHLVNLNLYYSLNRAFDTWKELENELGSYEANEADLDFFP